MLERRSFAQPAAIVHREPITSPRTAQPPLIAVPIERTVAMDIRVPLPEVDRHIYRVYLSAEWYVLVDDQGMVVSSCAEGALGYIVQLYSSDAVMPPVRGALKIPRMRADTLEENAYVCQILAGEAIAVFKALSGQRREGLIPTETTRTAHFLRDPRSLLRCSEEQAREQNDCIPFIHFGKDQRLRICNVKFEPDSPGGSPVLRVFPPTMQSQLSFLSYEDWRCFQEASGPDSDSRHHSYYFVGSPPSHAAERSLQGGSQGSSCMGHLDQMLDPERPEDIWYAHLPSVLFQWADGTLQRTLSIGAHSQWRLKEHYVLLEQVVKGLHTLHSKGIIHADVRPANVMAVGDLSKADHYMLSDYGSFTNDQASAGGAGSGFTTMPGVTRHRTSVFYARERRAGVEQENADVALIIGEPPGPESAGLYFVRLGWKAEVIDPKSGRVYPEVIRDMEKVLQSMIRRGEAGGGIDPVVSRGDTWRLTSGDQIRLRDYVFKLVDSRDEEREILLHDKPATLHCQDFLCDSRYTRVLLEKLAVRGNEFLFGVLPCAAPRSDESVLVLDLPRWVEIRQSSVASDLYSVGVMALYTVYTCARLNLSKSNRDSQPEGSLEGTVAPPSSAMPDEIEERIAKLVRRLEDEKNFNELWLNLTRACTLLESALRAGRSVDSLLQEPVESDGIESGPHAITRVKDFIESVVESLCDHAEELREIQEWSKNSAYFLLFVHFVLSCMHRRAHLDGHRMDQLRRRIAAGGSEVLGSEILLYPFCEDRCERSQSGSEPIAKRVLGRLTRLLSYFDQKIFFRELHARLQPNTNGPLAANGEVAGLQLQIRSLRSEKDYFVKELRRRDEELRALQQRNNERVALLQHQHQEALGSHTQAAKQAMEGMAQKLLHTRRQLDSLREAIRLRLPTIRHDIGKNQLSSKQLHRHATRLYEHIQPLWQLIAKLEERLTSRIRLGKLDEETHRELEQLRSSWSQLEPEYKQVSQSTDTVFLRLEQDPDLEAMLRQSAPEEEAPLHDAVTGEHDTIPLDVEDLSSAANG